MLQAVEIKWKEKRQFPTNKCLLLQHVKTFYKKKLIKTLWFTAMSHNLTVVKASSGQLTAYQRHQEGDFKPKSPMSCMIPGSVHSRDAFRAGRQTRPSFLALIPDFDPWDSSLWLPALDCSSFATSLSQTLSDRDIYFILNFSLIL